MNDNHRIVPIMTFLEYEVSNSWMTTHKWEWLRSLGAKYAKYQKFLEGRAIILLRRASNP
jgi:hypothetical protein